MFSKLFKLLFLSYQGIYYLSSKKLDNINIKKILNANNLDYGLSYKYKCLTCLSELYVTTNGSFFNDIKNIMNDNNNNEDERNLNLSVYIKKTYNIIYETVMRSGKNIIENNIDYFHPIHWFFLLGKTTEGISSFDEILSDIYAFEIFEKINKCKENKKEHKEFIELLLSELSNNKIDFKYLIGKEPSYEILIDNINISQSEENNSLFNFNENKKVNKGITKKINKDVNKDVNKDENEVIDKI
jgi:hypothetical protein